LVTFAPRTRTRGFSKTRPNPAQEERARRHRAKAASRDEAIGVMGARGAVGARGMTDLRSGWAFKECAVLEHDRRPRRVHPPGPPVCYGYASLCDKKQDDRSGLSSRELH
jgi:hypothetical protein